MAYIIDEAPLLEEQRVVLAGNTDDRPIPTSARYYSVQFRDAVVAGIPPATFLFGPLRVAAPAQPMIVYDRDHRGVQLLVPTNAAGAYDSVRLDNLAGANPIAASVAWYATAQLESILLAFGAGRLNLAWLRNVAFGPLAPGASVDLNMPANIPGATTHVLVAVREAAGMTYRCTFYNAALAELHHEDYAAPLAALPLYGQAQQFGDGNGGRLTITNTGGGGAPNVEGTVYCLVQVV